MTNVEALAQEQLEQLKQRASCGDVEAQLQLADYCFDNGIIEHNEHQAFKWYDTFAKATGDERARFQLARCYARGFGEPDDYESVFHLLEEYSRKGDADIAAALARFNLYGWGIPCNVSEAMRWFIEAADLGCSEAVSELSSCAYEQLTDGDAIFDHFSAKADTGDLIAFLNTALCQYYTICSRCKLEHAVEMFQAAIERGSLTAKAMLGVCYKYGYSVEQNSAKVLELLQSAADAGDMVAQYWLARCYYDADVAPSNPQKSFYWYTKAAAQGDSHSANELTNFYENGVCTKPDAARVYYQARQASLAGRKHTWLSLAEHYYRASGTAKNISRAALWCLRAAPHDVDAMFALESYCTDGVGLPSDPQRRFRFLERAAAYKCIAGTRALAQCYERGDGVQVDSERAQELQRRAEELERSRAADGRY